MMMTRMDDDDDNNNNEVSLPFFHLVSFKNMLNKTKIEYHQIMYMYVLVSPKKSYVKLRANGKAF